MATYDLAYPGAAIDAILNTAYFLQEAGYIFQGSASEYSGTPSKRVWLIAPAGFTGLGLSSAVPQGSFGICLYNGTAWVGKVINVLTLDSAPTRNSQNGVTSGGVAATLDEIAGGIMATFASLLFDDETASADLRTKLSYAVKFSVSDVYQTVTHLNILAATTSKAGLMSAEDKQKVDRMLTDFRSLSLTDTTAAADQATKIVQTLSATLGENPEAITTMTFLAATASKAGLMSAADKAILDCLVAMLGYYECSTAAGTAAKEVSASGYVLTNGGCIRIKMTNANTANNVTLNINSTGAKALYYDGAQASSTNTWEAGEVLEVYYDGTQYQCASGGGGKFATGEKVKDIGITSVLDNSDDLPTSAAVYQDIYGVQTVTPRTDPPVSSGFLNSNKTRIRILYACSGHGRCVASFTLPASMTHVEMICMKSYDPTTGTINSSNTVGSGQPITLGVETTMDWDNSDVHYILFNAYTGSTMTDNEYNTFVASLNVAIYDIVGEVGIDQRISVVEELVEQDLNFTQSLKDDVDDIYQDIYGVQTITPRTEPPVSSGFLNSNKTRIRILYACSGHGRCVASFTLPASMTHVEMICMKSYDPTTGTINSSNTVGSGQPITLGVETTMDWDNSDVHYILFNAYTGSTMTDNEYNTFVASLNVAIYDIVGEGGIDQRLSIVEELVEQGSSFTLDMLSGTNVKSLGAKGDGVADDTGVIQQALNAGGTVFIPNGTYLISNSLAIYSNTHLIMDEGAVLLRNSNNVKCIIYSYWEATTTEYNGQHDITIEGGVLDLGTGFTQGGCGLGFVHCQNVTIRDVTVKHVNSGYHNIDLGATKNARIENCLFMDALTDNTASEMLQIDSSGSRAAFPIIQYPDGSPCYDNTPCLNVEICGCRFFANAYSPAIGNHNNGAHRRIDIHDNFIYGSGNSRVRGAIAFANTDNLTDFVYIHDNFIDNFHYGFQFAGDTPINLWVKNNIFSRITNLRNSDSGEHGTFESNITAVV